MKKYLIINKNRILVLILFCFVFCNINTLYSQEEGKKNHYDLYTNTCDSINFFTMQFLLKDNSPNLDSFDFKGINNTWNENYLDGMLIGFFYDNYDNKETIINGYKKFCNNIEEKKLQFRGGRFYGETINGKYNFKEINNIDFILALDSLKSFAIEGAYNICGNYYLKKKLNEYRNLVIKRNFPDPLEEIVVEDVSNEGEQMEETVPGTKVEGSPAKPKSFVGENVTLDTKDQKNGGKDIDIPPVIHSEGLQLKDIILYLALGLATLGLFFWIISFITNYRSSKKRIPHQDTLDHLENKTFPHYDKALDEINNRIKFIVNKLDGLQKSLGIYNERIDNMTEEIGDKTVVQESFVDRHKEVVPKITRNYYLPFPDRQGYFWDDQKSDTLQSRSLFILELDGNNDKRGILSIDLNISKNVKSALSNPSGFLKPVCEITNNNLYGKSIEIVEKGLLRLEGNRWVIDNGKKIKIRII